MRSILKFSELACKNNHFNVRKSVLALPEKRVKYKTYKEQLVISDAFSFFILIGRGGDVNSDVKNREPPFQIFFDLLYQVGSSFSLLFQRLDYLQL